jgi:hypothetical protein
VWTIGREREKQHAAKFVRDPEQQAILFPVIDAVHDLNEGSGSPSAFIDVARTAMTNGEAAVWQNATNWIPKVGSEYPEVHSLWGELARNVSWNVRWRVACVLYGGVPDEQSDELFGDLRHDKSKKVRETAIDRYENRPGPDRYIVFKMFDAQNPASPGFWRN